MGAGIVMTAHTYTRVQGARSVQAAVMTRLSFSAGGEEQCWLTDFRALLEMAGLAETCSRSLRECFRQGKEDGKSCK